MQPTPHMIAFSAPSGAGKSTICRNLLERNEHFQLSISATTRAPRGDEQHGVEYFFLSDAAFREGIDRGDFLEYEEVHGKFYGTLRETVTTMIAAGKTVLFDIDVNGALSIKRQNPQALLVFIRPPSEAVLIERLRNRKTESEADIERRLQRLPYELQRAEQFDLNIVNDDLDATLTRIETHIKLHLQG